MSQGLLIHGLGGFDLALDYVSDELYSVVDGFECTLVCEVGGSEFGIL